MTGRTIVGRRGGQATLWTEGVGLWTVPGSEAWSVAKAVTPDGRLVGGYDLTPQGLGTRAWIWDAQHQLRSVDSIILEQLGTLPRSMESLIAMSADGRTLLLESNARTYVFTMPAPCAGDVDNGLGEGGRDGGVDAHDLTAFLGWFFGGDLRSDLDNGTGEGVPDLSVTVDDLVYFLTGFDEGC